MKKLFGIMLLTFTAVSFAAAQTNNKVEQELLNILHQLDEAIDKGDKAVYEKYLGDTYVSTRQNGAVRNKADVLTGMRAAPAGFKRTVTYADVKLAVFGDTAVMSRLATATRELNGQVSQNAERVTQTFVRQKGTWQVVAAHFTPMPAAAASVEKELMSIRLELDEAAKRGDKEPFERHLADGYLATDSNGAVRNKAQLINSLRPRPSGAQSSIEYQEIKTEVVGDTAMMTTKNISRAVINGQTLTQASRSTGSYVWQGGRWRVLARHTSAIPTTPTGIKLDAAILESYVGEYELTLGMVYVMTQAGDKLYGQLKGAAEKGQLIFTSENTFTDEGGKAQGTFVKDDTGKVVRLDYVLPNGQKVQLKKIK